MIEQKLFISAIEQICEEKGITREKVLETIEMALAAAYKKEYDRKGQNIKVNFNIETGDIEAFQVKLVVDESMLKAEEDGGEDAEPSFSKEVEEEEKKVRFNPERHLMAEEVKDLSPKEKAIFDNKKLTEAKKKEIQPGSEILFPLEISSDFGRIAAQTAKQVIIQRVREAEREAVYEDFKEKEGQVISGVIQRMESGKIFIDLGKVTGILFPEEQVPQENYRIGQRMKMYISEVQKDSRGATIHLSRAHPKIVSQLFALEVPEISAGTVEIKSIAREAGSRSKIAVSSTEEKVDPIGSMIGQRGTRVQTVINELNGEKIDIVQWNEDPVKYVKQSLSPAKIIDVEINKEKNQARVIVPEDQLSLTIGIQGQNVRLAARLTGWKIDVISQEKYAEERKGGKRKIIKTKKAQKADSQKEEKKSKVKKIKKAKKEGEADSQQKTEEKKS